MAERKPLVLLPDSTISQLPTNDHVAIPRGTLAVLNALGLGVGDIGAKAQCTDWAGSSRTVFWTGTTWQAENNYATAIKTVTAITDDSLFTNAAPPSGAVTPFVGTAIDGNLIVIDAVIGNNTKWGGIWVYNSTAEWTRARGFEDGAEIPNPSLFRVDGNVLVIYTLQRGAPSFLHQTRLGISGWTTDIFSQTTPTEGIYRVEATFDDDVINLVSGVPNGVSTPNIQTAGFANGALVAVDATNGGTSLGGLWLYNAFGDWTRFSGWEIGTLHGRNILVCISANTGILYFFAFVGVSGDSYSVGVGGNGLLYIAQAQISGGGGSGLTHQEVMARLALGSLI
jgi:hypothetical protein